MPENGTGFLKKVNSESVVQQIIDSLTDAMVRRQLKPGDRIPTETDLARELGVGRNSVREAMKILVYLGVLEIRRAEGTFVCSGFSESMIDPMVYGIILNGPEEQGDLMELRETMECGAIRAAVKKLRPGDLELIRERLDSYRTEIEKGPGNVEAIFWADESFHDGISTLSSNPMIEKLSRVVRVLTHSMRLKAVEGMLKSGRSSELYKVHERLYGLLESRDTTELEKIVADAARLGTVRM